MERQELGHGVGSPWGSGGMLCGKSRAQHSLQYVSRTLHPTSLAQQIQSNFILVKAQDFI